MSEKKNLKDVTDIPELLAYLEEKGRNHTVYYHYTSWDSFSKIYTGGSFLLTRGNSLTINDQHEAIMKGSMREWNKTYIGSFNFGHGENMAMWGLYGLPWEDAVRICIPKKAMLQWIDSIKEVYVWDGKKKKESLSARVRLSDIVYVSGEPAGSDLRLTRSDETLETKDKPALRAVDTRAEMTGFIKNHAWRYENEVRIHVRLPDSICYEKILITIPPEVLQEITVTKGPSFLHKGDAVYSKLFHEGKIRPSSFENLVRYRPLCQICKNAPFEKRSS